MEGVFQRGTQAVILQETAISGPPWEKENHRLKMMLPSKKKTNMEPENEALEEEISIKNPSFSGSMLVFGWVFHWLLGYPPWN